MGPDGRRWRVAAMCFDHMHIGDQLKVIDEHPDADLVGVFDTQPERMLRVAGDLGIATSRQYTDYERCLNDCRPDLVVLCPSTAEHAEWTLRVAPFDVHVMVEKPFAHDLAGADAMIDAVVGRGRELTVNWPLAWYPSHRTLRRLIAEGVLGQIVELHYYDGNRGPLLHEHGKRALDAAARDASGDSWFYRRDQGGGAMLDYLGYGVTLATWFLDGEAPLEVTTTQHIPDGLEVDTHSVVAARYAWGLSTFQTRWGTFSDPWTAQPQPGCGFVVAGTKATATSRDYADVVRLQTDEHPAGFDVPVDQAPVHERTAIGYTLHCLERGEPIAGPTSWQHSRTGQRITDAAQRSADRRRPVALKEVEHAPVAAGDMTT
jgi:predicted dehydrogenase